MSGDNNNHNNINITIEKVLVGKSKAFTKIGRTIINSAIDKKAKSGKVKVYFTHLEGNDVEHKPAHGGPDRVLLHYALENYDWIRQNIPEVDAALIKPGGFGENIVSRGLTEKDCCIGDIFQIGTAQIQISQPRMPCYQLNHRFKYKYFSRIMQAQRKSGWLYRVIKEGEIYEGCTMNLIERPYPNLTVFKVQGVEIRDITYPQDLLKEIANCELLHDEWRDLAKEELKNGQVADDIERLEGGDLRYRHRTISDPCQPQMLLTKKGQQQEPKKKEYIFWILACLVVIFILQYLPVVE